MIHRVPARCGNCSTPLTVRIVVAGGVQPFAFACPHCDAALRSTLHARIEPLELRLESEDLLALDAEDPDALAVAVAVDMPVHLDLCGATGPAATISPFLHLVGELGSHRAHRLVKDVDHLRQLREKLFPGLRRAGARWADRDSARLAQALHAIPGSERVDWQDDTPDSAFEQLLGVLYAPIDQSDEREECVEELARHVGRALRRFPAQLADLMAEYEEGGLQEHRRRTVSAVFTALQDVDALLPALWVEAMQGVVDLQPYRVMRDDFPQRKSSYQDLFELSSMTLAFIVPIVNLADRADPNAYSDGTVRTPSKARHKTTAATREGWLVELPAARRRFEAVSRVTRNKIGHALVSQDVARGLLVYEDGREQNYMSFLLDWLNAVRLVRFAIDALMILDWARAVQDRHR